MAGPWRSLQETILTLHLILDAAIEIYIARLVNETLTPRAEPPTPDVLKFNEGFLVAGKRIRKADARNVWDQGILLLFVILLQRQDMEQSGAGCVAKLCINQMMQIVCLAASRYCWLQARGMHKL